MTENTIDTKPDPATDGGLDLDQIFETDSKLENQGFELQYGKAVIRVAYAGRTNKAYVRALSKALKPFRRLIEAGISDDPRMTRAVAEVFADTIIKAWSDVYLGGKLVPYTKDNVVKVLLAYPALFDDLRDQAGSLANFRAYEDGVDAKN